MVFGLLLRVTVRTVSSVQQFVLSHSGYIDVIAVYNLFLCANTHFLARVQYFVSSVAICIALGYFVIPLIVSPLFLCLSPSRHPISLKRVWEFIHSIRLFQITKAFSAVVLIKFESIVTILTFKFMNKLTLIITISRLNNFGGEEREWSLIDSLREWNMMEK